MLIIVALSRRAPRAAQKERGNVRTHVPSVSLPVSVLTFARFEGGFIHAAKGLQLP